MAENENADFGPDAEAIDTTQSWLLSLSREVGRTIRLGKQGIDLLVDASGAALNTATTVTGKIVAIPKRARDLSSDEEAWFTELGSLVLECPGDDFTALKNDLEFWELIKRIHSIRGKASKDAIAEEQDEPDEGIPEVVPEESNASEDTFAAGIDAKDTTAEEQETTEPPAEG